MPTRYPPEQMHRIRYTKLTSEQIVGTLSAAADGPASASPLSEVLAGTSLRIVLDSGPVLNYRFTSRNRVSISEGDAAAVQAGYGALTLDRLVLFSHMVPRTLRGYTVVIDPDTSLATVFEAWFSGYEDNREVQRQIYYGYVEQSGRPAPAARHGITNRIEGKGFYWKQDSGVETIEYYPSVMYSNFVELTRFGGELSFCAPSDYIRIDDKYIYSRVEAEFSGTMTTYLLDANRAEQIGMRLGFDDTDTLEYYMFTGRGEGVGQIAQFEPFGDIGATIPLGNRNVSTAKGGRPVYRPMKTNPILTKPQVDAAVAKNKTIFPERSAMAGNKGPISSFLAGKELTCRYDNGVAIDYRFDEIQRLRWRRAGESAWREERYESWESAPGVIMFGHLLSGAPDHDAFSIVIDFDEALVTSSCTSPTGWRKRATARSARSSSTCGRCAIVEWTMLPDRTVCV